MVYSHGERRTLLMSAVAFVALVVAAFIFTIPDSPNNDAGGREIQAYYLQHATSVGIGAWLFTLSFAPFLMFLAQLSAIIRRSGEDARILATAAFGGGVAAVALLGASNAATIAAAFRATYDANPLGAVGAVSLWDLSGALYVLSAIPMSVFVTSAAMASLRHAIMPIWLAVVGLFIGAGLLVPWFSWAMYLVFPVWILAVGVALSRRAEGTQPATRHTASPTPA
jgi:hypothetical protein